MWRSHGLFHICLLAKVEFKTHIYSKFTSTEKWRLFDFFSIIINLLKVETTGLFNLYKLLEEEIIWFIQCYLSTEMGTTWFIIFGLAHFSAVLFWSSHCCYPVYPRHFHCRRSCCCLNKNTVQKGVTKRCRLSLLTNSALSQWVQLCTSRDMEPK